MKIVYLMDNYLFKEKNLSISYCPYVSFVFPKFSSNFIKIIAWRAMNFLDSVKLSFLDNLKILKTFEANKPNLPEIVLTNNKLKAAANVINIPRVFRPYQRYISNTLGKDINLDLNITADQVRENDDTILESFSKSNFSFRNFNLDRMIRSLFISCEELRFINYSEKDTFSTVESAFENLPKDTSASFPFYGKKSLDININDSKDFVNSFIISPSLERIMQQPCTLYHRYSVTLNEELNENTIKSRLVWGFPFRITLLESVIFKTRLERVNNFSSSPYCNISAIGKNRASISEDIIRNLRSKTSDIASVDFKNFDSTIPSWFWAMFYAMIKETGIYNPNELIVLKDMMIYHCNTPYCNRSTTIKYNGQGMPSGSYITSLADTIFNRMVLNYASLENTKDMVPIRDYAAVLGDDNGISLEYISFPYLLDLYKRVGLNINKEKSSVTKWYQDFDLFGLTWNKENAPIRPLKWYVSHLCVPKKFIRNSEIPIPLLQTYRALSIVAGLLDGYNILVSLMNGQDYVLNGLIDQYNKGEDPSIVYISGDNKKNNLRIPLSVIINIGWKAF